ncbi:amidohydrolase family protein [Mycolicibacterium setense]
MDEANEVRKIWTDLGLPGIVDVHTHFMPKNVMDKVWQYFDSQGPLIGREWPITYRADEAKRVNTLREFGIRKFTSLVYPHKPNMAAWLNQWAHGFAKDTPDCLATATFYPEPEARGYVADAIAAGTQVFKAHIQVGNYEPNDPLLDDVWGLIEDAGVPVVIHCGSGPAPGDFTGPEPIAGLLSRYPRLALIVAHMGMPEYSAFLDLAERYDNVRLDTTMAFTPFVEEMMPFPGADMNRLKSLGEHILFGSDFPNIPYGYAEAVHHLIDLPGVDDAWRRNVLHDNAAKLFGLS